MRDEAADRLAIELSAFMRRYIDARLAELGVVSRAQTPRALRIAAGLSVSEVADRAGVSIGYISQLENGRLKNIGSRNKAGLARIAEIVGVSASEYRQACLNWRGANDDALGHAASANRRGHAASGCGVDPDACAKDAGARV
jgi:transcriptional regulator with XRE-family HTH domain